VLIRQDLAGEILLVRREILLEPLSRASPLTSTTLDDGAGATAPTFASASRLRRPESLCPRKTACLSWRGPLGDGPNTPQAWSCTCSFGWC